MTYSQSFNENIFVATDGAISVVGLVISFLFISLSYPSF